MINKQEIQKLERFTNGLILGNGEGCYDIEQFDTEKEIDNTLTCLENQEILKDKINKRFPRTIEVSVTELKKDYDCQKEKEDYETNSLKDHLEIKEVIPTLFDKPKLIGILGDINSGKSNFLYSLISELKKSYNFNLYTYGFRFNLNEDKIHSVEELETIKDSIIIVDEYASLWDISDRKKRKLIEKSLRLISHNNNILVLVGLPENFVKYISSKCNIFIYFKSNLSDFINGSRAKNICLNYRGFELGSSMLDLNKDECIIYNWNYSKIKIPYLSEFDSKKNNKNILCPKKGAKKVEKEKKEVK